MKLTLIVSLFLFILINQSLAQETSDSLKFNSNKTNILDTSLESKIYVLDFNKGAVIKPLQLIQGKVPGFTINCLNTNDPNPETQIQLRDPSTLYLYTDPLYIVDGVPLESPDIVPVENIESIEVLKNLSETGLYGIRGSNGVVLIKTKRGGDLILR